MKNALKAVGLERLAINNGMNEVVSEQGGNLSGGEKKRLSLARALIRQKPVIFLDEPLANCDPINVSILEDSILNIKGATVIVISHRFNPLKRNRFDRVIDVEGGKINASDVE